MKISTLSFALVFIAAAFLYGQASYSPIAPFFRVPVAPAFKDPRSFIGGFIPDTTLRGYRVFVNEEQAQNEDWTPICYNNYRYDDSGRVMAWQVSAWNQKTVSKWSCQTASILYGAGFNASSRDTIWNADGRMDRYRHEWLADSGLMIEAFVLSYTPLHQIMDSAYHRFIYDSLGKLLIWSTFPNGAAEQRTVHTYDEEGCLQEKLSQYKGYQGWVNMSREVWTFDTAIVCTALMTLEFTRTVINQNWMPADSTWANMSKEVCNVVPDGRIYKSVHYSWKNNGWSAVYTDVMEFDKEGRLGGASLSNQFYQFIYNASGHFKLVLAGGPQGGAGLVRLTYEYIAPVRVEGGAFLPAESLAMSVSPNPFNPGTEIRFSLREQMVVSLGIYDVSGRLVRLLHSGKTGPGAHALHWNGRDASGRALASGLYIARLEGKGVSTVKRVQLMR